MKNYTHRFFRFFILLLIAINLRSLAIFTMENSGLIRLGGDSGYFVSGQLSSHTIPYASYIGLVAISRSMGFGTNGVVVFQVGLSLIAAMAIFDMTKSRLLTAYYLSNYELMKWNYYILSDSFFISLIIISVWSLQQAVKKPNYFLFSGLLCFLTAFARPNGIILFLVWILFVFVPNIKKRWLLGSLLSFGFLAAVLLMTISAGQRGIFIYATNGELIWSNRDWLIKISPALINTNNSVFGVILYAFKHPILFTQLFVGKILVELLRIRPFLPLGYNLFLLLNTLPWYFFSLKAIYKPTSSQVMILFIITLQLGLIGLTYADWDGRFLAYIFPLFLILSQPQLHNQA